MEGAAPNETSQLMLAWIKVQTRMEQTSMPNGYFEKTFDSHPDPTEDDTFLEFCPRNAGENGASQDRDGKLTAKIKIATPRVHGSITYSRRELTVSIGLMRDEVREIETRPQAILRQKIMGYTYQGLGPLTCSIVNPQGECLRSFPVHRNGTGRVAVEGIPFPFSIKLDVTEGEPAEQAPLPKNGMQFFLEGDYAAVEVA